MSTQPLSKISFFCAQDTDLEQFSHIVTQCVGSRIGLGQNFLGNIVQLKTIYGTVVTTVFLFFLDRGKCISRPYERGRLSTIFFIEIYMQSGDDYQQFF